MNNKKKKPFDIGFYILIVIVVLAVIFMLMSGGEKETMRYSDMRHLFEQEKVESFTVEGTTLTMYLREPYEGSMLAVCELYSFGVFYEDMAELIDGQYADGTLLYYDYKVGWQTPWWLSFLPYLVLLVIFIIVWFVLMNRGAGGDKGVMKFSRARTRLGSPERNKVTFKDVAGADEEKEELQEIVEFLKDPKRFTEIGARIPKGVLLVGPPGTGKTLLAKAVAGEAGVQFLSISGSDFVELYVGVGASRVRDLFDQAKKAAPSIVFIDEIDAVGRQRGAGYGGGHDEREQTLNQLLVELDGFGTNEGVIVMAATNRQDILDRALLRPGRFDRQIYVGYPDIKGREAILKVHAKGKPLGDDVDLAVVAKTTTGFTGADLENLLNEAALLAARRGGRFITMPDIQNAMIKVIAGPEKKSKVVPEHERKLVAYHEAGHAVASSVLDTHDPVHQISIIPRGTTGGMTIYLPQEDKGFNSKKEMEESLVSLLGGRIAEKLMLDDISTGASNDIQRATAISRSMVTRFGMSERLGPVVLESDSNEVFLGRDFGHTKSYSERTASEIDEEVRRIIEEAYTRCESILKENMDILEITAQYLLENETMEGEVFQYLCEHRELPPEPVKEPETPEQARMKEPDGYIDHFFGSRPEGDAEEGAAEASAAEQAEPAAEENDKE